MVEILFLNTRGGFPKKSTFVRKWCEQSRIQVAAIVETHLCSQSCQGQHRFRCIRMRPMRGWTWVGRSREGRKGGGVGFLIRDGVAYRVREDLETQGAEDFWVELVSEREGSFLLCCVYIPPNSASQLSEFRATLNAAVAVTQRVVVVGDFNGRSLALGDTKQNPQGEKVLELISSCNMLLENTEGVFTRPKSEAVLDLVLATPKASDRLSQWAAHDVFKSDHQGVTFRLRFSPKADKVAPRLAWNFRRANWARYQHNLEDALDRWLRESDLSGTLDALYESWIDIILEVARSVVPRKKVTGNSKPGTTEELSRLSKVRKKALRRKKKCDTPEIRSRIRQARAAIEAEIENGKIRALERLLDFPVTATTNDMWDRFKRIDPLRKSRLYYDLENAC